MSRSRYHQREQKPSPSYEVRDVAPRYVLLAGIMLFGGIALSVLATFAILDLVSPAGQIRASGFGQRETSGGPLLEVSPASDRAILQNRTQARIAGYGRIDGSTQTARIPVDRAIDILAARGWPDPEGGPP